MLLQNSTQIKSPNWSVPQRLGLAKNQLNSKFQFELVVIVSRQTNLGEQSEPVPARGSKLHSLGVAQSKVPPLRQSTHQLSIYTSASSVSRVQSNSPRATCTPTDVLDTLYQKWSSNPTSFSLLILWKDHTHCLDKIGYL